MRILALLLEFIFPLVLIGLGVSLAYQYVKFNSFYKNWKTQKEKIKSTYPTFSFTQLTEDWEEFLQAFKKYVPSETKPHFDKITENIENLKNKAQTENWDTVKNRPASVRPLYDIVYSHIPDMVEELVEMPNKLANTQKNHDGKTAVELFQENMALLATSTDTIVEDAFKDNLKELSVHKEYLKHKFGS